MKKKQKEKNNREGSIISSNIKIKQERGITLIALVITIIVLLILAAISIATLTGDNGILTKASDASKETNKSTAKERITLEVLNSIADSGELNIEKLNENLKLHIQELTHEEQSLEDNPITNLPTNVELNGFMFQIDQYGKVTEEQGTDIKKIELSQNSLKLKITIVGNKKTYEEQELTANLVGISGEISWNAEGDAVDVTPLGDRASVKVKAKNAGEATIIATCSGKTAQCNVIVEEERSPYLDNSYVQYNVEYTDVYNTQMQYTKDTGWRSITDLRSFEQEGKYTGTIEIISTGIPAVLNYYHTNIADATWAGTSEQREKFVQEYYGTSTNKNIYAAAGLLYNFKKIVFNYKVNNASYDTNVDRNYGGFKNIVTNGKPATAENTTTGESLFTADISNGTIEGIRSVNLEDITGSKKEPNDTLIHINEDWRYSFFNLHRTWKWII